MKITTNELKNEFANTQGFENMEDFEYNPDCLNFHLEKEKETIYRYDDGDNEFYIVESEYEICVGLEIE
jgi:hypothetical protein